MTDTKDLSAEQAAQLNNLIHGRAKRSTAGRHMSALLNAEADDDLALLFEEVADDNDFFEDEDGEGEAGDGDEDDALESSSDDDDQGPNANEDDFEGEQELQREAKAESKKRRKQQQPFNLQSLRKRVKIDDPATDAAESTDTTAGGGAGDAGGAAAPRPKKKSERISWLPTVEEGPTRSSSRRQTMQNKQVTHAKLKDSEQKRIRLIATMEEAAKRKAHLKPKEMTQAQRLAEAERVERHNSKSLNRWEEMEKRKAEERLAKIEALQNRRLEGPVISYWSGLATWINGRLTRVGKADITQKAEKDENARKKSKKAEKDTNAGTERDSQVVAVETIGQGVNGEAAKPDQGPLDQTVDSNGVQTVQTAQTPGGQTGDPTDIQTDGQTEEKANEQANQENGDDKTLEKMELEPAAPTTDAIATQPTAPTGQPTTEEVRPADEAAKGNDAMDIDEKPMEPAGPEGKETPTADPAQQAADVTSDITPSDTTPKDTTPKDATPKEALSTPAQAPEIGTTPTPAPVTAAAEAAPQPQTENVPTPTPTPQEQLAAEIHMDQPVASREEEAAAAAATTGVEETPAHPPTIEQTGRTLTILENFDDKTAHSREYSTYFNAKKPPRLTSEFSILTCPCPNPAKFPSRPPVSLLYPQPYDKMT